MADEFTIEQQKAIAIAEARAKAEAAGEDQSSWTDVIKQAVPKGVSSALDSIINTPENAANLLRMQSGMNASSNEAMLGAMGGEQQDPQMQDVEIPPNRTRDYLQEQGFIDPSKTSNMSPGQEIVDTGIQGAVGGAFGGGAGATGVARNALVGGAATATGEAVAQWTGNEALGLAAAVLSPIGASRIAVLNKSREEAQALNALRDATNIDAQGLGFVVVPETEIARFADRPKLLEAAAGINQRKTNDVARSALDIPATTPISNKILDTLRGRLYDRGYMPLKKLGRVTTDNDFLDDLDRIEREYTGAAGSFPEDVAPKMRELVDNYLKSDFDAGDVVDKIKTLRRRATKNINSDDPINNEYGFAQQKIAEAMEGQLERSAVQMGWPSTMVENYRSARKLIAVSHTVGSALNSADGNVSMNKLGKMIDKGQYMDGDLAKVARFASINKPKVGPKDERLPFSYMAGGSAGFALTQALDLPPWTAGLLVSGGALGARAAHHAISAPIREYLLSKPGQARGTPDYSSLGIDARQGPLSGMMFENSQGVQ